MILNNYYLENGFIMQWLQNLLDADSIHVCYKAIDEVSQNYLPMLQGELKDKGIIKPSDENAAAADSVTIRYSLENSTLSPEQIDKLLFKCSLLSTYLVNKNAEEGTSEQENIVLALSTIAYQELIVQKAKTALSIDPNDYDQEYGINAGESKEGVYNKYANDLMNTLDSKIQPIIEKKYFHLLSLNQLDKLSQVELENFFTEIEDKNTNYLKQFEILQAHLAFGITLLNDRIIQLENKIASIEEKKSKTPADNDKKLLALEAKKQAKLCCIDKLKKMIGSEPKLDSLQGLHDHMQRLISESQQGTCPLTKDTMASLQVEFSQMRERISDDIIKPLEHEAHEKHKHDGFLIKIKNWFKGLFTTNLEKIPVRKLADRTVFSMSFFFHDAKENTKFIERYPKKDFTERFGM